MPLLPWVEGPFELIAEAEIHYRAGGDSDRRLAFINFDNAIEVSIGAYLSLHPTLRGNRTYKREDVSKWTANFHTKIEFFYEECERRSTQVVVEREMLIYCHDLRGDQYHGSKASAPYIRDLDLCRHASLWVFSVLHEYDLNEVHVLLDERIAQLGTPADEIERDDRIDQALDDAYGLIEIGNYVYFTSEVLYATDRSAYRELGLELLAEPITISSSSGSKVVEFPGDQRSAG